MAWPSASQARPATPATLTYRSTDDASGGPCARLPERTAMNALIGTLREDELDLLRDTEPDRMAALDEGTRA